MNNKQQTAVTWLIAELISNKLMALRYDSDNTFGEIIEKAKQMEKEQVEISDEEIKYAAYRDESVNIGMEPESAFIDGAKWYREQLKKR